MQFSFDTNLNRIAEKVEANEHLFKIFFNFCDEIF